MIEIRWVTDGKGNLQLQQRTRLICSDAAGAFCEFTEWSEWQSVPIVHDEQAVRSVLDEFGTQSAR